MGARKTLLQLQTRIYRRLREECKHVLGKTPAAIQKYEAEYRRDFNIPSKGLRSLDRSDLVKEIRARDVSFVADYHTFAQAQRTALRLIRDATTPAQTSEDTHERWLIGLEMISTRHQEILDRFQAGDLTRGEFHRLVRYEDSWGFPWSHYEPIFEWARDNKVRLVALNQSEGAEESPTGTAVANRGTDLDSRDRWAAAVITELFARAPRGQRPRMIVLFGELHIGTRHLPRALAQASSERLGEPLRMLSVHQNNDSLYWKLARDGREHRAQILKLKRDSYCVFSSTPWAKLESLLNWTDAGPEPEDPSDAAAEGAGAPSLDLLSSMRSYCQSIAEFLQVEPPDFGSLTAHAIQDADFVENLEGFDRTERSLIRALVAANERFYLPRARIAYLASPSMNHLAEAGALHLLRSRTSDDRFASREREDFFRRILESSFGFMGSLILNPRRKCDLAEDHARKIETLRDVKGKAARLEVQARESVLKFLRAASGGARGFSLRGVRPRANLADWMAARYVGRILARKLHGALLGGELKPRDLAAVFLTPPLPGARRPWEERYFKLDRRAAPARLETSKSQVI